jgi:hypothetical protein
MLPYEKKYYSIYECCMGKMQPHVIIRECPENGGKRNPKRVFPGSGQIIAVKLEDVGIWYIVLRITDQVYPHAIAEA